MIVFRRRLIFWLIKAYFRKWGRTILFFFVIGLLAFFVLQYAAGILPSSFPLLSRTTVGISGAYSINDLPADILEKVSTGLTIVSDDGTIHPGIAGGWKIRDNGKTYIFYLKKNVYFSDGKHLTSNEVNYSFKDVTIEKPNEYTLIFKLKEAYSPFLVTVSRPIFKKGFVGVGSYRIKKLNLNGNFVSSIDLSPVRGSFGIIKYIFYPTEDAMKTALVLGEVTEIEGIHDLTYNEKEFDDFKSLKITKELNRRQLVTLFYNTQDPVLSDKKIRNAFSYTMPDKFEEGERNQSPIAPNSWASSDSGVYFKDIEIAKELLSTSSASDSSKLKLILKTLPQYNDVAGILEKDFEKLGIKIEVEKVDSVPDNFQMFLGDFNLSKDPDQYVLWHSSQNSNIARYRNLRIDKLLEDGRRTVDVNERKQIYSDFQKYLLDDSPATFLYLPYTYTVSRN